MVEGRDIAMIQYKQVVIWDANVIDVGFLGSEQSVPLALRGLGINGVYIVTGAPAATVGQWAPGAQIYNAVDGTFYLNTGSTASPVWSLVENAGDQPLETLAYNSDATAGPLTIAAAKVVNALLDRDGGATNRADTTDTAVALLAAVPGAAIGSTFKFFYRNISTSIGQVITLGGGLGVTISGKANIIAGQTQEYIARFTNVGTAAVTLYAVQNQKNAELTSKAIAALGTTQNTTPTAAQLLGGILTQTGATGAGTATLPNGTLLSAAVPGVAVGDSFEALYAVLGGAQTITVTGDTGSTVIGTAAIPSGKNARLTFINTGTNTWNVYVTVSA